MERLCNDIIKKSNLTELSSSKSNLNSKKLKAKAKKIYKYAVDTRGGVESKYQYQRASQIQDLVIKFALFL